MKRLKKLLIELWKNEDGFIATGTILATVATAALTTGAKALTSKVIGGGGGGGGGPSLVAVDGGPAPTTGGIPAVVAQGSVATAPPAGGGLIEISAFDDQEAVGNNVASSIANFWSRSLQA